MRRKSSSLCFEMFKTLKITKYFSAMIVFSLLSFYSVNAQTVVNSLEDLIAVVKESDQTIVMEAGNYNMEDLESSIRNILCSGSNNSIDLTGVYVKVPVGSTSTTYITISGNNNTLIGGEFEDTYNNGLTEVTDFSAYNQDRVNLAKGLRGAAVMDVTGDDNLIDGIKLTVRGSYPYGYGSMFGIGSDNVFGLDKRCGLLVTGGSRNTIDNVEIQQRAFGHGFFVQGDADQTVVKNTYVEGRVRAYSELYEETNSYDLPYRSNYLLPMENNEPYPEGDVFSLCEDGIRMYNIPGSIEVENCTVKKMRGGIRLYLGGPATVTNSTAIDCGTTNWNMPTGGLVTNSSGNFAYAPLSDFRSSRSDMDLEWTIIPSPHATGPHNLADVLGGGHKIVFHRTPGPLDPNTRPIVVTGYGSTITNETEYPIILESSARSNTIVSFGPVIDYGASNNVEQIDGSYDASLTIEAEDYFVMSGVETTTTTDDVDGNKVSSIDAGDWIEYEMTIPTTGIYSFDYRVSGAFNGDFKVELDNVTIDEVIFDATGGDEAWETVRSASPIYLTEGVQTIRITSNVAGWNLNWIQLLAECFDTPITPYIETTNALGVVLSREQTAEITAFSGITVSLEPMEEVGGSWSWSGPNGYSSSAREIILSEAQIVDSGNYIATYTNTCGQQTQETFIVNVTESLVFEAESYDQMNGVLIEATTDVGGGDNIYEIDNGDWVEFEIYVPFTASFYIDYRVSSATTGGSFAVSSDGLNIDNLSFDATGGAQAWETSSSSSLTVLNGGKHTIRITSTMDEWSLNWFELKVDQIVSICELPFAHDDIVIRNETYDWSSEPMSITCSDSVSVFAKIKKTGELDDADYLNLYYKLDGGDLTPISENTGLSDDGFVYVENLTGNVIEIVIEGYTSSSNKTFTVSNLLMQYGSVFLSDKIEAEDYDEIISGTTIAVENCVDEGGGYQLGYLSDGDWCMFEDVDLTNVIGVTARVAGRASGTIEVRLGSPSGTLISSIDMTATGGWTAYESFSADVASTVGLHDLYFVLPVEFNINWFQFSIDGSAKLPLSFERVINKAEIYPNPTRGILHVKTEKNQYAQLEIFNITGTRILKRNINDEENSFNLNLENLSKGIYVMVLKKEERIERHKIIKR